MQGNLAQRVKSELDERFDKLEEIVQNGLKDKLIVCVKRGSKLKIV